ncbi:MAG: spermidine/putrescine ABC transporter substrate-binding protein [Acidimicrobiales bacterium]|nr:spermidine/putrescine ABC transporter substrate-binding protein [Acidimicrobiales bacterium]
MARTAPLWTRRRFLRNSAALLGGVGVMPGLLTACGGDDSASPAARSSADGSGSTTLTVDSWPIYIDDDPAEGTVARFEAATGISLTWNETINDNNEYFAKIQPVLSDGKTIGADIISPTYWLVPRLVQLGWLEPLPIDAIPNRANLLPSLKNPSWDPGGEYSLPWQTGITGIAYNRKVTGKVIGSMADFFAPALSGKVGVLTEMRDTIGLLMLADGQDPASATFERAESAFARLQEAKESGHIRRFTGQDYLDDLVAGNFAACVAWSGDVAQLALDNPDIGFAIPEEGGMRFADCMVIPKGAANIDNAARFMDFVYNPANAARITAAVQYISPVQGVDEALRQLGGEAAALADSTVLFPDAATTSRLHVFGSLSEEDEARFDEAFSAIASV